MLSNKKRVFIIGITFTVPLLLWHFILAQEEFIYEAKNKRDPFIALVTNDGKFLQLEKEEAPTGLILEGIIYDKHGISYALINGAVAKVGDFVLDYQVLKIEENRVILIKEGQITELELKRGKNKDETKE